MDISSPISYRPTAGSCSTKGLWLLCFVLLAGLYVFTCQRGIGWQDSGRFQWRVARGDYSGDIGLASAHPLCVVLGRAAIPLPGDNLAWRINAIGALGMAVAMANLAAAVAVLTGRRWIGLATAGMLGVSHTIWWLATISEVYYGWALAGLTGELWLLAILMGRPRWTVLTGLAVVNGLGLCAHNMALLALPVYAVVAVVLVAKRKLPAWSLAAAAGGYLLGAGGYIAMTAHLAYTGGDIIAAVRSALVGDFAKEVLNTTVISSRIKANAAIASMNLLGALPILAIVGWVKLRGRVGGAMAAALAALTGIYVLFVVRYPVADQFTFLGPTLALLAVAGGVGLAVLVDASRNLRRVAIIAVAASVLLGPAVLTAMPTIIRRAGAEPHRPRELPGRDEMRYWLVPWKHTEDSAETFAAAALAQAGPDGVILTDSTGYYPLVGLGDRNGPSASTMIIRTSAAKENYDRDPAAFKQAIGRRNIYILAPANWEDLGKLAVDTKHFQLPGEVLYRLYWPGEGPPTAPPGSELGS